jgi:acylphosphatase
VAVRVRVIVRGRVQGVFFRDSCRAEARARGVSGWVRNLANGDVEAVFEGERDDVEAMLAWCREGPPRARVEGIELHDEVPDGEQGFRVF